VRPWQLLLCLGTTDRAADAAVTVDLGLAQGPSRRPPQMAVTGAATKK